MADGRWQVAEAQGLIDTFMTSHAGVERFVREALEAARADGGKVFTLLGRCRWLEDLVSTDGGKRHAAQRQAINAICQVPLLSCRVCVWMLCVCASLCPTVCVYVCVCVLVDYMYVCVSMYICSRGPE